MEKAALKIDLSTFPAEALEKMNEMFNGDYAGAMAETDAAIERGVDLYLSAVGRSVEVWNKGKAIQQRLPGLITTRKKIIIYWSLPTGVRSVSGTAGFRRWDMANFTEYLTRRLVNAVLNF